MAIERVLDAFSGDEKQHAQHQLAGALRFVVAQALLPSVDGGRVPVVELLSATYAVSALVREGRTHMLSTQLETGGEHGMVPMERSLVSWARASCAPRCAPPLDMCRRKRSLGHFLKRCRFPEASRGV